MNRLIVILPILLIFSGCASFKKSGPPPNPTVISPEKLQVRNNAASLLYDLLSDEKNVSKILIIKKNRQELGELIKAISDLARDGAKQLAQLAKNDPTLNLQLLGLPAGEKATRVAIAKTKEHELLFSSGENFEFALLLTQAEALSYGWHLAKIAGENSTSLEQAHQFSSLSVKLEDLYKQVVALMRSPPK